MIYIFIILLVIVFLFLIKRKIDGFLSYSMLKEDVPESEYFIFKSVQKELKEVNKPILRDVTELMFKNKNEFSDIYDYTQVG